MVAFWVFVVLLIVVAVVTLATRSTRRANAPPLTRTETTSALPVPAPDYGRPLGSTDVELGEQFEMPTRDGRHITERYGLDRLLLMVRDPYWLFAYWELTPARELRAESSVGAEAYAQATPVLRLRDIDTDEWWDTECSLTTGKWYLNPARPGHQFVVELGRIIRPDRYLLLLRSNVVRAPTDRPSHLWDAEWAIPEELWHRLHPWGYRRLVGGSSPGWEGLRVEPAGRSPGQGGTLWERSG